MVDFARCVPAACLVLWLLDGVLGEDVSSFRSRPDLFPPVMKIETSVPQKLSPGYIFITPYEAQNPGPYIYDNEGNLVWSGWGNSGPGNAHGMHVCQYQGADHLCFFQGNQQKGYCRGHGVILDRQYRIVRSVQPGGGMSSSDMHEFRPVGGGKTALMTVYQQRQFDMSPWNVKAGLGWLMESVFQEVDVETSKVLFEWRSLDHVDPSVSYTYPDHTDTSGNGLDRLSPWDYFHINSIDKNAAGDYLVSSRHTCCIYKISGRDGSVVWRLHGANPSFRNINFSFSQQHDARWLSENATHTLLSLYNNGYNGFNRTHDYSSGMIVLIDHTDNTATLLHEFAPPGNGMLSSSQGNLQLLPNNNVFIGWGNNPYVSEYDADGNLLLWASFADQVVMNYRAHKFDWDADPTDSPALWTYSRTDDPASSSSLNFYVSWNGATRVRRWKFYGALNQTGPYTALAEAVKTGFETWYPFDTSGSGVFYPWTYAEAIDAHGKPLARSSPKFTFVPSPEVRAFCGEASCDAAASYGLPGDHNRDVLIPDPGINTVPWVDSDHLQSSPGPPAYSGPTHESSAHSPVNPSWIIIGFAIPAALISGYFFLRCYRRNRVGSAAGAADADDDADDDSRKPASSSTVALLPWWLSWSQRKTTRYFPLRERTPGAAHGS